MPAQLARSFGGIRAGEQRVRGPRVCEKCFPGQGVASRHLEHQGVREADRCAVDDHRAAIPEVAHRPIEPVHRQPGCLDEQHDVLPIAENGEQHDDVTLVRVEIDERRGHHVAQMRGHVAVTAVQGEMQCEEGNPTGRGTHPPGPNPIGRDGHLFEQFGDRIVGQRIEDERARRRQPHQLRDPGARHAGIRPGRHQECHPRPREFARDERHQVRRRRIRPVDVLHDHEGGIPAAEFAEQFDHPGEQPRRRQRPIDAGDPLSGPDEWRDTAPDLRRDEGRQLREPPDDLTDHLDHGSERQPGLEDGRALAGGDLESVCHGPVDHLLDEAGLADPRFAADHDDAGSSGGHRREHIHHPVTFGGASHQANSRCGHSPSMAHR